MRFIPCIAAVMYLSSGAVSADEMMRCGNSVVSSATPLAEFLEKCGEPSSKKATEEDIRTAVGNGRGTRKIGTTVKEWWTYDRGSNALAMVVTIVDGKIQSIDTVR